jgi:putative copper export protein
VLALSTWVGGLALLVEKKSRRMELALYVLSRWGLASFLPGSLRPTGCWK